MSAIVRLPPQAAGMRIGLYGGSFNPPHLGHRHVSLMAMKRLGLDRVWWLVSPGNPLKDRRHLPPSLERQALARALARHPRIDVTGFESDIGATYTVETIRFLTKRCPDVHFVWIMGADSLVSFHRWEDWRAIASLVPMAIIDRPGWTLRAGASPAARTLASARVPETEARLLADMAPPAWVFLHGPRSSLSSTALRVKLALSGQAG